MNVVVALDTAIGCCRLMQVVVIAALFGLGIILALTMSDFLTRGWLTYR